MIGNSPSLSYENYEYYFKKRRVSRACDSCRIKKTKCDGEKPCNRCTSDNKICVYTLKRKEKSHPNGYIELMETRVDLLTKSLEKMIELSKPHLPFLKELMYQDRDMSHCVSINRVIEYLIQNERILYRDSIEGQNGALKAANISNDSNYIKEASKKFYERNLGEPLSIVTDHHFTYNETKPDALVAQLNYNKPVTSASPIEYEEKWPNSASKTLELNGLTVEEFLSSEVGNTYLDTFSEFESSNNPTLA